MRRLERLLNRNARLASLWSHPAIIRTAKVYPYFIMHYHFARLVRTDVVCREIWEKTPVYLVGAVTKLLRSVISPMTETLMRDIQNPQIPMHKLTWKYDPDEFREGCVLDYLARSLD
jgi:UDP-N-acetyl-D-mannosaminuronate dehydrogenase